MTRIYSKHKKTGNTYTPVIAHYEKVRKEVHRQLVIENLGGKCSVCGTTEGKLWFNYIGDAAQSPKKRLSRFIGGNIEILLSKIVDYELLCVPHWWEERKKIIGTLKHGTLGMYSCPRTQCRCAKCVKAGRAYAVKHMRERRKKQKQALADLKSGKYNFLKDGSKI